jgi:hypothetical protein
LLYPPFQPPRRDAQGFGDRLHAIGLTGHAIYANPDTRAYTSLYNLEIFEDGTISERGQ